MKLGRRIPCLVLMIWMCSCKAAPELPPLYVPVPRDIEILPPDSSLPSDIKAFSGRWQGSWNETLPHVLVVERITLPDVTAIYAVGRSTSGRGEPTWRRVRGSIKPGLLRISFERSIATYRLQPDGELEAIMEGGGAVARAKMKRFE